jgi:hypothetical protein
VLIQRAPLSKTRLYTGESWLHAVTLDDSTPPCRISELRVWSYEPFIVPPSSSSGSTRRQNLEILYIINHMTHNKNGKNIIKIMTVKGAVSLGDTQLFLIGLNLIRKADRMYW